jgi:dTDP-glucose pyrophosphorylase
MRNISLIIPAAGEGQRFKVAGFDSPKPLIKVKGTPMIMWVVQNFNLTEKDEVIIIQQSKHELAMQLKKYLISVKASIKFVTVEGLTLGPAKTVMHATSFVNKENAVIVANSDQYVSQGLKEFVGKIRNSKNSGLILTMAANGNKWSYVKRDNRNVKILEVREKVEISREATVGIYGWSNSKLMIDGFNEMFSKNDLANGEFYVAPSYNYLIKKGIEVLPFFIGDHSEAVHGLGTPEDLSHFEKSKIDFLHND